MFQSDFLRGGTTLKGKAGSLAIAANDLLMLNSFGQLYPVNTSDNAAVGNAGSLPFVKTTVSSYAATAPGAASTPWGQSTLQEVFRDAPSGAVFMACPYLASNYGLQLYKYSAGGALIGSLILSSGATVPYYVSINQLSNTNLVVTWSNGATAGVHFAIVDLNLNPIVTDTAVIAANLTTNVACVALAAGGFAICYGVAAGVYRAIYTNAGGVTLAATLIAGTPTAAAACVNVAQLSNANLVIAARQPNGTANFLGHCIVSSTGAAVVLAFTNLNATTSASNTFGPVISVLAGYYCIAASESTDRGVAYVLNNAGALQGAPFNAGTFGGVLAGLQVGGQGVAVVNDGTAFWLVCSCQAGAGAVVCMPTTGTGYVASLIAGVANVSAIYDRGFIVVFAYTGPSLLVLQSTALNAAVQVASISLAGNVSASPAALLPAGDFCVLLGTIITTASVFSVTKYLDTAVVGVSQQTLAAGNAGTLIAYSHGGGAGKNGYPTNAMIGTVGKSFDHSATNLVGNKGTMLGNSVSLEGIV